MIIYNNVYKFICFKFKEKNHFLIKGLHTEYGYCDWTLGSGIL